jgi:hypothetical protein
MLLVHLVCGSIEGIMFARGTQMSHEAVFLDRDGTLIEDQKYAFDPLRIRFTPYAPEGLRRLSEAGYRLVVITNQSGVARGYFGEDAVQTMHDYLGQALLLTGDEAVLRDKRPSDEDQPPGAQPTATAHDLLEAAMIILGQEAKLAYGKRT